MFSNLLLLAVLSLGTACSEDALDTEAKDAITNIDSMETKDDAMKEEDNGSTSDDNDSEDGDAVDDSVNNGKEEGRNPCSDIKDYIFIEKDGLVNVEFEDSEFSGEWKLRKDETSFSGKGYMVWEGDQHLGNPGNAMATFNIKIANPGTYQFLWKTAVKTGNSGTDHNDSWLRFADADDFYAQKDDSVVYPKDTGKTPNPEGASKDGWFKIYRSGNDLDFKWQAKTFDNNAHDIFVKFENPGTYSMEVSVRSSGHGIDKFVLFKDRSMENALADSNDLSGISCQ